MPKPPPQAILLSLIALFLAGALVVWRLDDGMPAIIARESSTHSKSNPPPPNTSQPRQETAVTFEGTPEQPSTRQVNQGPKPPTAASSFTPLPPPPPITPEELRTFAKLPYTAGTPATRGEPVTAYVRVTSRGRRENQDRDVALTVNQANEFPRLPAEPGETVQIRLAFASSPPGTPVAVAAQDGGAVEVDGERGRSLAGALDEQSQLALAYRLTRTAGLHRVTVRTPNGDTKVLEFWAGPLPQRKKLDD